LVTNALEQNAVGAEFGCFAFQALHNGIRLSLRGEREGALTGCVEQGDFFVF
jgi:hypothetical protein